MQEVICRKEIILKSTYFVVVFPRIVCNNCKRIAENTPHHLSYTVEFLQWLFTSDFYYRKNMMWISSIFYFIIVDIYIKILAYSFRVYHKLACFYWQLNSLS